MEKQPHKHKDLIIAWANGAEIQYRFLTDNEWRDTKNPSWNSNIYIYRVKPEEDPYRELKETYAEGKTIQVKTTSGWRDLNDEGSPNWFLDVNQYRIKPEEDPFKELKEAYAAGKTIQVFTDEFGWSDWVLFTVSPEWNSGIERYRIKPEEDPYAHLKKAHAAGKTIEILIFETWFDLCSNPNWTSPVDRYRIKPEPKPKYVPFTWEDRFKLIGESVKHKSGNFESKIVNFQVLDSVFLINGVSTDILLKYYMFLDGRPFGRLVDES